MSALRTAALVLLALCMHACAENARTAGQYELEGQVLAIRETENEVLIKHGDIKGFMPGMTMPFKVRESTLLTGLGPGDLVRATLSVADTTATLVSLRKTGSAPLTEAPAIPAASFVAPLKPGDAVPDTRLTDQTGAPVSLSDWTGSAVALTFIYVRCPLPQFCPLLDRRFADIQQRIAEDTLLRGRARLLSVSFDPDADTPERLHAHARRLHADSDVWRFATAPRETVDRFAAQFGVNVIRERDGTITHNMRTTVIDPDGRVRRVFESSDWTAADVLDEMRRALAE